MPNTGKSKETNRQHRKVVFIDRDGVINFDPIGDYIKRWEDFKFLPGVLESLKKLTEAGFEIVIISNQAGIGDGVYQKSALDEITANMLAIFKKEKIALSGIYYCLHGKKEDCECRKPKAGLFKQAAAEIAFDPSETYFIGDKVSDVQAGSNFGLRNIFVLTGHGALQQHQLEPSHRPEIILPSLKQAVDYLIEKELS